MPNNHNTFSLNPLVSVIIPCYNCEKYVEAAIQSIIKQTYTNLEILITDDCSSDNTYSILMNLAKSDSRIILFRNEKNIKIVKTLNDMVIQAKGKYIARMDGDDISHSKRIQYQVEFLEANPGFAMCGCNSWHINKNNSLIGKSFLPLKNADIQIYKNFASPFYHPSIMIKSDIYKNNLYDERFLWVEDYELWSRILISHQAENLKQRLLYYRVIATSISNSRKKEQQEKHKKIISLRYKNNAPLLRELKPFYAFANLIVMTIKNNYSIDSGIYKNVCPIKIVVCFIYYFLIMAYNKLFIRSINIC